MQVGDTENQRLSAVESVGKEVLSLLVTRLERAVDTLQRLQAGTATLPAGTRSAWPEMVRKSRFTEGKTRSSSRALPSAEAIDDLDRLAMLFWELTRAIASCCGHVPAGSGGRNSASVSAAAAQRWPVITVWR